MALKPAGLVTCLVMQ